VTFASSLDSLSQWRSTRLPWPRYLPLAALLVWAASSAGGASIASIVAGFFVAFSLIAQFRLWDDLADRARDRARDPQRVVVRAQSIAPFETFVLLLGAANAIALWWTFGAHALAGQLLLMSAAALCYACCQGRGLLHAAVLHLKYPAFVCLIAPPISEGFGLIRSAVIVYAAMLAFELWDEPQPRDTAPRVHRNAQPGRLRYLPFALAACALAFITWGEPR